MLLKSAQYKGIRMEKNKAHKEISTGSVFVAPAPALPCASLAFHIHIHIYLNAIMLGHVRTNPNTYCRLFVLGQDKKALCRNFVMLVQTFGEHII